MKTQELLTGIGFVLFNHKGKIFTVKELKAKPQYSKEVGMVSFPLETQEEVDNGDFDTVRRIIKEEMDPRFLRHIYCRVENKIDFKVIPQRPDIITRYHFGFLNESAPTDIRIADTDIEFNGWLTPAQLFFADSVRVEVRPILKHFFENYRNVV